MEAICNGSGGDTVEGGSLSFWAHPASSAGDSSSFPSGVRWKVAASCSSPLAHSLCSCLPIPLRCALEGRRILLFSFGSGVMASMLALVGRAVTTPPFRQHDFRQGRRVREQGSSGTGPEGSVAKRQRQHDYCEGWEGGPTRTQQQRPEEERELDVQEEGGMAECPQDERRLADDGGASCIGGSIIGDFHLQAMAEKVWTPPSFRHTHMQGIHPYSSAL